jgi:hypothetical protein
VRPVLIACLVCACGALYLPHVLVAGFVFQDWRSVGLISEPWQRPLSRALWAAEPSAIMVHGLNLGLHGLATLLVGCLALRLDWSPNASLAAAAVFALTATQVEPVAYATGLADVLSTVFVLAACLAGMKRQTRWMTPIGLIEGIAAKETALVGLAVSALSTRRWRTTAWAGVAVLALAMLGALWLTLPAPTWTWTLTEATAIFRTLWVTVTGIGHTPIADYQFTPHWFEWVALGSLLSSAWYCWQKRIIGGIWIALCLLPRLAISTAPAILNDHQMYLSMVGVALLAAHFVEPRYAQN